MATGRIGTTPVLTTRWSKAPAAGTTSLSGLDDNSVSLVYSVGYEAVYRNGTLLSRGNDYTATNGTSITLIDATLAGDIIEVFANQTIPLTDTYSQTVADGRFIRNTLTTTTGDIIYASAANTPARLGIGSTDQVLKVSGGIPAWGAAPYPTFGGVLVKNSTATTVPSGVSTTLTFNQEVYDTDGYHSTSSNTDRLTVPTGKAGYYSVFAWGMWTSTGLISIGQILIDKNTNELIRVRMQKRTSDWTSIVALGTFYLNDGDYLQMSVYHDAGSNQTWENTGSYGSFGMYRVG
jgi:hypothetical protein